MRRFALPILACGMIVSPALAHHGWSSYDDSKTIRLSAPVESLSYENPHGELRLQSEGKTWRVILAPPSRMMARGLSPEMLKPGTAVQVEGYPSKNHADEMRAERITVDGKRIELR